MYEDAPISTYFFEYFSILSFLTGQLKWRLFFLSIFLAFFACFFASFDSFLMKALGVPLAMRAIITAAAERAEGGRKGREAKYNILCGRNYSISIGMLSIIPATPLTTLLPPSTFLLSPSSSIVAGFISQFVKSSGKFMTFIEILFVSALSCTTSVRLCLFFVCL